ncbi:MAG TPA: fumarate/nitrate reduction transcriptional regulator Fnr [Gammaproteobacteria bacterium]|nr:fumarate/nitrate reduction transcriptional regulator Fnr [Gammaproteobacteria bacterium]
MSQSCVTPIHDFNQLKVSCGACSLTDICLPHGLNPEEQEILDTLIQHKPSLKRGESLFHAGDPLKCIYAVRSGSFKTFINTADGAEQITGFYLPGELIGLDGLGHDQHRCGSLALESSSVCAMNMDEFEEVCSQIGNLRRQLLRLIGKEINQDHESLLALGQLKGEERLATFLLSLGKRYQERGFSAAEFNLSMPRHDLANYLGLAVETLSRMFSKLQDDGVLSAKRRNIRILDEQRLRKLAHWQCRNINSL